MGIGSTDETTEPDTPDDDACDAVTPEVITCDDDDDEDSPDVVTCEDSHDVVTCDDSPDSPVELSRKVADGRFCG